MKPKPEIVAWLAETTGGCVCRLERVTGGNRRQSWFVDVAMPGGEVRELVLRCDELGDPSRDHYHLGREAAVYRLVNRLGVRAPALIGEDRRLNSLLMERVHGRSSLRQASSLECEALARDFGQCLAYLHRATITATDASELGPRSSLREHVKEELRVWESLYRSTDQSDPLIEFGLAWLQRYLPPVDNPVVLTHGDAGPGNFLFEDGRVTGLIDWEFAHFGDPMEDLAWLSMRSVFEPGLDFAECLRHYVEGGGFPVDDLRLRYHRVFVELRVAVIRHCDGADEQSSSDPGNSLVSRAVNRRLLVEALSGSTQPFGEVGLDLPEDARGEHTWLYNAALGDLREVILPALADGRAQAKAKSLARVLKYLRERERYGAALEREKRRELERALGAKVGDVASGEGELARAIAAGEVEEKAALRYLTTMVATEQAELRDVLGALATRHLAEIPAQHGA